MAASLGIGVIVAAGLALLAVASRSDVKDQQV
jgi:hypothetical protein